MLLLDLSDYQPSRETDTQASGVYSGHFSSRLYDLCKEAPDSGISTVQTWHRDTTCPESLVIVFRIPTPT